MASAFRTCTDAIHFFDPALKIVSSRDTSRSSPSGVLDVALARGRREITLQTLRQADNLVPD